MATKFHAALMPYLDAFDEVQKSLEWKALERLDSYFEGTQYDGRPLDADGYRPSGIYGTTNRTPPWKDRQCPAVWNLVAEISEKLTDWTLGGSNWCHLEVLGDELAEDFLATIEEQSGMSHVVAQARTYGGAMGVGIVSFVIDEGEFFLEAHKPLGARVLEWADARRHRPLAVVKVQRGENPDAHNPGDYPWTARYWDEQIEANLVRVKTQQGQWVWKLDGEAVTHGLGSCPVYWCPNATTDSRHAGVVDAPKIGGIVDEVNELFAAAGGTTKRNADDTLVVKTAPSNNSGRAIRKGGANAIFSEGGAEYLSQSGESAKVCMEVADRRASQAFRRACVENESHENPATSGEERKVRLAPMTARAATLRRGWSRGLIVPLCVGMLEAARKVGAGALRLPPRFDADGGKLARGPGESSFVRPSWPTQFPPTPADVKMLVETAVAGTVGKQVLSQKTAIKMLAANGAIPVENAEEEIDRIEADGQKSADQMATASGLVTEATVAATPTPADDEEDVTT